MRRITALPWFAAAPAVVLLTAGVAVFAFVFTSDLFNETCANERNLLTGELVASNCGEGAEIARADSGTDADGTPPSTSSPPSATALPQTPTPTSEPSPTPAPTEDATVAMPEDGPGVLAVGMLVDGEPGHDGSGGVELQRLADGSHNVFISSLSVTNGPDLFVVLSRSADGDYQDGDLVLESLTANHGNQNYAVPAGVDVLEFRTVIIWCRAFDVTFAYAVLEAM